MQAIRGAKELSLMGQPGKPRPGNPPRNPDPDEPPPVEEPPRPIQPPRPDNPPPPMQAREPSERGHAQGPTMPTLTLDDDELRALCDLLTDVTRQPDRFPLSPKRRA